MWPLNSAAFYSRDFSWRRIVVCLSRTLSRITKTESVVWLGFGIAAWVLIAAGTQRGGHHVGLFEPQLDRPTSCGGQPEENASARGPFLNTSETEYLYIYIYIISLYKRARRWKWESRLKVNVRGISSYCFVIRNNNNIEFLCFFSWA